MTFNKKVKVAAVCAVVISVTAVLYYLSLSSRTVATVGDYKITRKQEILRDEIQKIFYPSDPKNYGLEQLERAYTYAQILKNNGLEITEATLRAEEMRINQNTKSPETLEKIRALFNGDDEAYYRVFILPTYAERVIYYEFFNKNPKAQAKSLAKVASFLKLVSAPNASFENSAKSEKLVIKKLMLSKAEGLEWENAEKTEPAPKGRALEKKAGQAAASEPEPVVQISTSKEEGRLREQMGLQNREQSLAAATFWVDKVLPGLNPGEVLKEPVDFGEQWLVVKYERALPKNKYQLSAAFVPKDDYNSWLEAEKAKIKNTAR